MKDAAFVVVIAVAVGCMFAALVSQQLRVRRIRRERRRTIVVDVSPPAHEKALLVATMVCIVAAWALLLI